MIEIFRFVGISDYMKEMSKTELKEDSVFQIESLSREFRMSRSHSPGIGVNVVAATVPFSPLKEENNSAAAGRDSGWRKPSRLQSRAITVPWGRREEKIP